MNSEPRQDIAIVGMSVRLPEADDVARFLDNLRAGRDSVRELSPARRRATSLPLDAEYQVSGYLEEIDTFDHAFFDISRGEANNMAPEQRLLLQVAYEAVENAGYDPDSLHGSATSVYVGDTRFDYPLLARTMEPTMVMGTHVAATAGRISRFLGLRGVAAMVDSSCSSALLAVRHAVNDLILGDADLAMVGGANLNLFGEPTASDGLDLGIRSADGRTRTFSVDADGTGSGEAVVVVLLKRLADAVRDGDVVHAVIKGIAANNVAGRASTLTAPDSASQADVIERAWRKAGIDPTTVSYVEAHGTATRLGDPIEIEALDIAFGRVTSQKHCCAVSSVKSNIGHTWSASGLVGLVKAVLALRHHTLFPNLHAQKLSPLIDFDNSAVTVTQELTPWHPASGVRRAGVSSFGVMGTNVHAILEEAPDREPTAAPPAGTGWFPVSARSATAARANIAALADWLADHPDTPIADLQQTLVGGRAHRAYRHGVTARDFTELRAALAAPVDLLEPVGDARVVLLVSGSGAPSRDQVAEFRGAHPRFDALYAECERAAADLADNPLFAQFAFGYACHGLLRHIGLPIKLVVADGLGKHVLDAAAGRVELAEAITRACRAPATPATDLPARVDRLLARLADDQPVLFVETGPVGTISRALLDRDDATYQVLAVTDGPAAFLRDLYLAGADWTWTTTAGSGRRIELPTYRFDRIRCWLPDDNIRLPDGTTTERHDETPQDANVRDFITAVWRDVLGVDEVAPDASFFALGGDSISGIQVINRLQVRYAIELDGFALLEHDTPTALADYVEEMAGTTATPSPAETSTTEPCPTTPAQLQVWLASQFDGGSVAFNLTRALRLTGTVHTDALRRALDALADRHEALRAGFHFTDGELSQTIAPATGFAVPLELTTVDEVDVDATVAEFAARPFDLATGPLLRAQLVTSAPQTHQLTLSTHHIVADGWSLGLLVRDLGELYGAFAREHAPALAPVGIGYREHHQRAAERAANGRTRDAEYWLDTFATVPAQPDLPVRSGSGEAAFVGAYRSYALPPRLWARLKDYAQAGGATPFTSVLSLFAALFSRYTEQGELVLGTSVAGRASQALEDMVGMLVRTVPLRLRVDPARGFGELLGEVRHAFGAALGHQDYPYEELVEELRRRDVVHAPHLFNVLIEFERFADVGPSPAGSMAGPELVVEPVEVTLRTSVFPLNIMLAENESTLAAAIRYDTRLFDEDIVDGLWHAFAALAESVLDRPAEPLAQLPLLPEPEHSRVRTIGHRELAFDPTCQIHHAIERFARLTPDRTCLSNADTRRTYAEVNTRANQLARYFTEHLGVQEGDVVALVMDRLPLMVESILALWKCGAAYLPVSPNYPPAFVRMMLESARVRLAVLAPAQVRSELRAHIPADCTVVDLTDDTTDGLDGTDLDRPVDENGVAYVIYTSGSTGTPKGVMVEHLGMLNHLHAKIDELGLSEDSVIVQNASNSFDISLWQMFAAPFRGGRTVIVDEAAQLDPLAFADRIEREHVTVLEVVPSYLDVLLDAWQQPDRLITPTALRYLMVTGEACLPRQVNRWLAAYPTVPVINAYGPTEASDDVTHHIIREPVRSEIVPLGRPIPNTYVYVLDEHLRVLPQGARGEIYVSGICVGRGYLNAPEQTARAFLTDPFVPGRRMYRTGDTGRWTADGLLETMGRNDSQVKVRGFRVDLGEIERHLDGSPGVRSAAVVVNGAGNDKQLHGYVVLEPGGTVEQCRAHLLRELPEHMVPSEFVVLDWLPLTSNGKVDRTALRQREPARAPRADTVAPRTDTERLLVGIWQEVLGQDEIGVTDQFFQLGGDSLRAMRILARVRQELGAAPGLEVLFTAPTIAGLAAALPDSRTTDADEPIVSIGGPGTYDTLATQDITLEIERSSAQRAAFNRNDLYELRGDIDPDQVAQAFALLTERHESLRTTYGPLAGTTMQTVHAPGALPLPFRVHDLSTEPDDALTAFVQRRIREPFEPETEPPVRADLLRVGPDRWALLVAMHQLIADGVSAHVLGEEWQALLAGTSPGLAPLRFQFKDVAAARNARLTPERRAQHREFWARELAGASSLVPIPTDLPRPPVSALAGTRLTIPLPDELTARFAALARTQEVTEFVVARAAVGLLLLAETGLDDVTIGTYTSGRDRSDLADQIGCYINTVPLRFRLEPDEDVPGLLRRSQQDILRAFHHEEYPYEWTMQDLGWQRGPERSPRFDVMVSMDQLPAQAAPGLFVPQDLPRRAKEADLQFTFLRHPDRLDLALTYNSEIFTPARARTFLATLCTIMTAMVENLSIAEILRRERTER